MLITFFSHSVIIKAEQHGVTEARLQQLRGSLWNVNQALEQLLRQQLEARRTQTLAPQAPDAQHWISPTEMPVGIIGVKFKMAEVTVCYYMCG